MSRSFLQVPTTGAASRQGRDQDFDNRHSIPSSPPSLTISHCQSPFRSRPRVPPESSPFLSIIEVIISDIRIQVSFHSVL
jgi:hypothetical protein